jgi:hypothetical protein
MKSGRFGDRFRGSSMAYIRCPYCHQYVDEAAYRIHEAQHTKLRPDGQHTDYATLPAEERQQGDLSGVPRVYVHVPCGVATGMPEEIIRSYVKDPFMHSDRTFCCGCHTHVPLRECVWTETGQDLQSYKDELRRSKSHSIRHRRLALVLISISIAGLVLVLCLETLG